MKHRKVTPAEFDRGAAICRMEERTIALVRSVIVDGQKQSAAAIQFKQTKQRVSEAVKKMREYIAEANPVPPGWVADTVILPAGDWAAVRKLERAARARLRQRQEATAMDKSRRGVSSQKRA